ncbi:hypothetical protein D3C72_1170900 [compost metagenome]
MHGQPLRLQRRRDLSRAFEPGPRQGFRVQQDRRQLPEQVGLRSAALRRIEPGRDQAAAGIAISEAALAQLFLDAPLRQALAVKHGLGQLRLRVCILQAGQKPGLSQGDPPGLQRLEGDGGQRRKGRQTADLDFAITQGASDGLHAETRLQHAAYGGDDIGDMDGHGRIGQDDRRRLARPVGLDEDLHGVIVVDEAAVAQKPQSQQPPTSVQDHIGRFVPPPRSDSRKLQQTGGGDGVRQLGNVIIGRLAMAKVLGGEVKVAQAHDGLAAHRPSGRRCG